MKIPPAIFAFAVQLLDVGYYTEALALARIEWEPEPYDAALWRLDNSLFLSFRRVGYYVLPVLANAADRLTEAMR